MQLNLNRMHVHVTMFVSESVPHQTGVLFATCITGVCKYAVHECVCVCVCVCMCVCCVCVVCVCVWLCIRKYDIR